MYSIDTIIKQQVNSFNGRVTRFMEDSDREINETYLGVNVIDENQNQLKIFIPFDGSKPFVLEQNSI